MATEQLLLFVAAGLLLNLTPGPDVLYIVSQSLRAGVRAGVAAALGIRYRKLPAGGFNHTSLITLLDPGGKIVSQSEGLNRDNATIVRWLSNRS